MERIDNPRRIPNWPVGKGLPHQQLAMAGFNSTPAPNGTRFPSHGASNRADRVNCWYARINVAVIDQPSYGKPATYHMVIDPCRIHWVARAITPRYGGDAGLGCCRTVTSSIGTSLCTDPCCPSGFLCPAISG